MRGGPSVETDSEAGLENGDVFRDSKCIFRDKPRYAKYAEKGNIGRRSILHQKSHFRNCGIESRCVCTQMVRVHIRMRASRAEQLDDIEQTRKAKRFCGCKFSWDDGGTTHRKQPRSPSSPPST